MLGLLIVVCVGCTFLGILLVVLAAVNFVETHILAHPPKDLNEPYFQAICDRLNRR
jgi:hypothetical protein